MATTASLEPMKHGETFALSCVYQEGDTPTDITGFSIRSQVRTLRDELIEELTVMVADQGEALGTFVLTSADPSAWPTETLICDIRIADDAESVRHSDTLLIPIAKEITR